MDDKMPRRMMRFYRTAEQKNSKDTSEIQESTGNYREQSEYKTPQNKPQKNLENLESPTGRSILNQMPSMDYLDVNLEMDQKNVEEFKKIQQKNLEEKLALNEIQKFKIENKRLPNQKESDQIAETLYTQLKNSTSTELYLKETKTQFNQTEQNTKRGRKGVELNKTMNLEEKLNPNQQSNTNTQTQNLGNINNILGTNEKQVNQKKKSSDDEFNLDLGDEENPPSIEDISSIEDIKDDSLGEIELDDKQKCPSCNKNADNILYCPNCGTAFCENCSKKQNESYLCPKCGTKTSK